MDFFGNILGQGKNANPSIKQGTSQFEAGNYSEAVKSFEKALKIDPENGLVRFSLGQALTCLGRDGEAVICLPAPPARPDCRPSRML